MFNKFLVLLVTGSISLFFIICRSNLFIGVIQPIEQQQQNGIKSIDRVTERSIKKIFVWNSPHRIEVASFGKGQRAFVEAGCEVSDCALYANSSRLWSSVVRSDYRLLENFDAILVNVHELPYSFLPPISIGRYKRSEEQRFIFFTQESPVSMSLNLTQLDGLFNWTMSYKMDSDVLLLYGHIEKVDRPSDPVRSMKDVIKRKRKQVAWMVSHCETSIRREDYVAELQKYIDVDVYGKCGKLRCPRNETHWISHPKCYKRLATEYKFYLAFENSICNDYVTEKLFSILQHDIVPVVLGGADYTRIAPPHSFIDARQFEGPEQLADYLKRLDTDDDLYAEYFEWKKDYEVEAGFEQMARHAFCDLCSKLHRDESVKYYTSLAPFWSVETQCSNSSIIQPR